MSIQRYERIPEFSAGDRLRKARESAGLDQTELSDMTGISRSTVSHLELGKAPLKRSYVQLWSMATGVPPEWLEHGIAVPPRPPAPSGDTDALRALTRSKLAQKRRHAGEPTTEGYLVAA